MAAETASYGGIPAAGRFAPSATSARFASDAHLFPCTFSSFIYFLHNASSVTWEHSLGRFRRRRHIGHGKYSMFYRDERLALFIDGSNLYAAAKALAFDIDYKLLRQEFMQRGKLLRAFYYTALLE
ncbi:NYN domain-containing protein, partial [Roseicyclus sp.]|uniref:NYN domain-containing protein n=1 Tax=Roseicyclus sp. TaxID=1914329 RepID=UPI003F9FBF13